MAQACTNVYNVANLLKLLECQPGHERVPATAQSVAGTAQARAHVYLLRGLMNIFSLGMDSLAEETRLVRQRIGERDAEQSAKAGRNSSRSIATMVLVAYRHGLRPVELVTLRWDAIDFAHGQIHVSRAKNGSPSVHPLSGVELRALRRLKRDQEPPSPFVFTSERGAPFTTAGWRKMVARLGVAAKLGFKAHPHMFRHACGFQLANQGTDTRTLQAYLGHRNIQHTVRYTELSPTRFKNLWRD